MWQSLAFDQQQRGEAIVENVLFQEVRPHAAAAQLSPKRGAWGRVNQPVEQSRQSSPSPLVLVREFGLATSGVSVTLTRKVPVNERASD